MTAIDFNEPSEGRMNSIGKPALTIVNTGPLGAGIGIYVTSNGRGGSAVVGISERNASGVGLPTVAAGVYGKSNAEGVGVRGETNSNRQSTDQLSAEPPGAVVGISTGRAPGGWFQSNGGGGVVGVTFSGSATDAAVLGVSGGLPLAGKFHGNVEVTGDIRLLNADCAEDFDIVGSENVDAGTVMVLNELGSLQPSYQEYDRKVAGVVSGASGYKPAIVLDRLQESQVDQNDKKKIRLPIALIGKVFCKVDARHSSVEIGDLLTTSSTRGHAMKADDPMKAFGTVIGKALASIKGELGMIPVLIALQ